MPGSLKLFLYLNRPGRMKLLTTSILVALLCITPVAQARVYKWIDDHGRTHVTNDFSKVPRSQRGQYQSTPKPPEEKSNPPAASTAEKKPPSSPKAKPEDDTDAIARAHIEERKQAVEKAREKHEHLKARLAEINLTKKIDNIERQRYFDEHKEEFRQLELEALRLENKIMDAWGELQSEELKLQREITYWENEKKRRKGK